MAIYNPNEMEISLQTAHDNKWSTYRLLPVHGLFEETDSGILLVSLKLNNRVFFYRNNNLDIGKNAQLILSMAEKATPLGLAGRGAAYGSRAGLIGAAAGGVLGLITGLTVRDIAAEMKKDKEGMYNGSTLYFKKRIIPFNKYGKN